MPTQKLKRPALVFWENAELRTFNTLALPAIAAHLTTISAVEQLPALCQQSEFIGRRRLLLGSGSNLVFTRDFDGLVLHMGIGGRKLVGEDDHAWYVQAGAGENWHEFVTWTLAHGWPGLENLALIPGTVGAAPIQNIGAYGLEISERLHSIEAYDFVEHQSMSFKQEDCRFAYRDSLFKQEGWHLAGRLAITSVTFRLAKSWAALTRYADLASELETHGIDSPSPRQIANAVIAIRQRKLPDPLTLPNAGSFFQNPLVDAQTAQRLATRYPNLPCYPQANGWVKLAAGWLIEQAGWKGRNLGPAGMFERQALVLVNHGGAGGQDIVALAEAVQADVKQRFAIELQPEPVFV